MEVTLSEESRKALAKDVAEELIKLGTREEFSSSVAKLARLLEEDNLSTSSHRLSNIFYGSEMGDFISSVRKLDQIMSDSRIDTLIRSLNNRY